MQIRKRLRINNLILIMSVVALASGLAVCAQLAHRAMQRVMDAHELSVLRHELLVLRDDYLRGRSERAREQLKAKNRQIDQMLQGMAARAAEAEEKALMELLIANQAATRDALDALLARTSAAAGSRGNPALLTPVESRMVSQLNMRVYEVAILSARLRDYSRGQ